MSRLRHIASSLAVGAAALCAIGLAASVRPPTEVAPLDAVVAATRQRRADRLRERPPASVSEGTEGSATEHYDAAMRAAEDAMRDVRLGLITWDVTKQELRVTRDSAWCTVLGDELTAHRAAFAPAIAAMQRGARCREASAESSIHSEFPAYQLVQAAWAEVALRANEGCAADAVPLWLDLATFMLDRDYGVWQSCWTTDTVASLPVDVAPSLADGLERLERRLLEPVDVAARIPWMVAELRAATITDWSWEEALAAWEHGFDASARHLAALEAVAEHLDVLEPVASANEDREAQWQLFVDVIKPRCWGDGHVSVWIEGALANERGRLIRLADLRSLRLGLAARLGTPVPTLADPMTNAPFRVDEDGATIVVQRQPPHSPDRWIRCP